LPYTKQINNLTRKQNYESKTVDVSMSNYSLIENWIKNNMNF